MPGVQTFAANLNFVVRPPMVTFAEISLLNATLSSLSLSGMFKSSWYRKDSCVHHIYGFINLHAFLSFCIWDESGKLWPVSDCHLNHVH